MRVGVYNRWLRTLGGGERVMLTIASVLRDVGEVDLVGVDMPTPAEIAERLAVPLDGVNFVELARPEEATAASACYDLFINTSFMDPVRTLARRSACYVFFPSATFETPEPSPARLRRVLRQRVTPFLQLPAFDGGFSAIPGNGALLGWTGDVAAMRIPSPGRAPEVVLELTGLDPRGAPTRLAVRSGADVVAEACAPPAPDVTTVRCTPTARRLDGAFDLSLHAVPDGRGEGVPWRLGVVGVTVRGREVAHAVVRGVGMGHVDTTLRPGLAPAFLAGYRDAWVSSEFVRRWTRRYWGVAADILHPPADVERIAAGSRPKQPLIVSIGRFFSGNHNKKHLEMVAAFRSMVDAGLRGWTLVLVGSIDPRPEHMAYFRSVQREAEGLPVRILVAPSSDELVDLIREARIYWHAAGYGENEQHEPVRLEHFGIATVEAMAGGCVPIVIGRAGQREIVRPGRDGFLWHDIDELTAQTWKVINDRSLEARLSEAAQRRSHDFSLRAFRDSLTHLVERLLA